MIGQRPTIFSQPIELAKEGENSLPCAFHSRRRRLTRIRHIEKHFTSSNFVRDIVIGMSDGLTVPFALAAGLSGAVQNTRLIVVGGLAEIAAGSIAMGLGGYLAARGDAEHYVQE